MTTSASPSAFHCVSRFDGRRMGPQRDVTYASHVVYLRERNKQLSQIAYFLYCAMTVKRQSIYVSIAMSYEVVCRS